MSIVDNRSNRPELLRLIPLVLGNLFVGAGLQVVVAAQVGVALADVLFAVQAPFLVLSAVVASLCTNVVMPRLARLEEVERWHAWRAATPVVLLWLAILCVAVAASHVLLAPWVIAARIAAHPAFFLAVSWFAVGCFATCLSAYQAAQTLASYDGRGSEASQLTGGLAALALSLPLVALFGVVGGAAVLVLRPVLAVVFEHQSMQRRRSLVQSVADRPKVCVDLFAGCGQLIPTYTVLKVSPLIDRTLLGHADTAILTVYVISIQILGAALGLFEKLAARRWLQRLATSLRPQAWASEYVSLMRRGVLGGAAVAIGVAIVAATSMSLGGVLSALPLQSSLAVWFVGFASMQIVLGALAQLAAMPMYAMDRIHAISALALFSSSLSILARVVGFVAIGVPGLLAGVLLYSLLNVILLHRANVREWHP